MYKKLHIIIKTELLLGGDDQTLSAVIAITDRYGQLGHLLHNIKLLRPILLFFSGFKRPK